MAIKRNNSKKISILNSGFTPGSNGVIVSTVSCSDEDAEFDVNIFDLESVPQTEMTFSILCEKGKFKKVLFLCTPADFDSCLCVWYHILSLLIVWFHSYDCVAFLTGLHMGSSSNLYLLSNKMNSVEQLLHYAEGKSYMAITHQFFHMNSCKKEKKAYVNCCGMLKLFIIAKLKFHRYNIPDLMNDIVKNCQNHFC